jgi:DNA-binding transcriptional regulator YdaS (Cro superfamily)
MDHTDRTPIERACDAVKGQSKLARLLGVSPANVNQWVMGIRPVPIERCVAIERATKGLVTRKDLRPDDWESIWPELARKRRRHVAAVAA